MSAELDYSKYGNLTPAFLLHVEVEDPYQVLKNDAGVVVLATVTGGYAKTINPKYPFDAEITGGWDKLTGTSAQLAKLSNQNCVLFLKSKKNGKGIVIDYTGVIDASEEQHKVIGGESKSITPDQTYLTSTFKYELDSDAKDEAWVYSKLTLGKGRCLRDDKGVLTFEYIVYILE